MTNNKEGTNMIKLSIYFHTKQGDFQLPAKMAFESGKVVMPTNHRHGIRASDSKSAYFSKSQGSVLDAMKKCLREHGVKLVKYDKVKDYKKFVKMQETGEFFNKEIDI